MSEKIPSKYQQDIYDFVPAQWRMMKAKRGGANVRPRNLVVKATAGSGKTHTTRELCRLLPDARVEVVSFNSSVAKNAAPLLPGNASSVTLHAVGKRGLEGYFQRRFATVDQMDRERGDGELAGNKSARIIAKMKERGEVDQYLPAALVRTLVSKAKGIGLVPTGAAVGSSRYPVDGICCDDDRDDAWLTLMSVFNIEYARPAVLVDAARRVLRTSIESSSAIIDFDDMIYIPTCLRDLRFSRRDVVMVDELQDLDAVQRRMIVKMCGGKEGVPGKDQDFQTLFVGVGDPRQAIYAWRGADSQSMDRCTEALDCSVLPLSVCYRCPTSHLDLARAYAPEIEARPDAPIGEVVDYRHLGSGGNFDGVDVDPSKLTPDLFQPGDVVICRLNAPLISVAYWLMKARVPCRVVGRDFGKGLISLLEGVKVGHAEPAIGKLRDRLRRMEKKDAQDPTLDGEPSEATSKLADSIAVLQSVCDNLADRAAINEATNNDHEDGADVGPIVLTAELVREIDHLFGDDSGDPSAFVTLSSIHRFKGGEADRVWWCDEDNCTPRPRAQAWQVQETENLRFVASTRSRHWLGFFSSEDL